MSQALILAPLALAVVLVVSGVAKLRDATAASAAFDNLKVPSQLASPLIRRALPWAEVVLGAALVVLPWPASIVAGVAAALLFGAYLWLVGRAFASGEQVDCNCFGTAAKSRVTSWTVARNIVLLVLSVLAIADAALNGGQPIARMFTDSFLWLVMVGLTGALALTILRDGKSAESAVTREQPGAAAETAANDLDYIREPIPAAVLLRADGSPVTTHQLVERGATLLIWVSLGCGPCSAIIPQIPGWRERMPQVSVWAVLTAQEDVERAPEAIADHLLVDVRGALMSTLGVAGNPGAVLLGADGLLAGGPLAGQLEVQDLVNDMIVQLDEAALDAPGTGDVITGEVVFDRSGPLEHLAGPGTGVHGPASDAPDGQPEA